jgi:hypothetical protein
MTGPETIALRVTKIGDIPRVDHFTVIWRGMPIGRIMKLSAKRWWWGCKYTNHLSLDDDRYGVDLDDCKAKFLIAWTRIRAGLTNEEIAKAYRMPSREQAT